MNNTVAAELTAKLQNIRLVVFDVDGILTNGQLLMLPDGQEVKQFNILDGLGIKLLMQAGIETAIITGRRSPQVEQRAKSLGINHLRQSREDKLTALTELWQETGHTAESTAYMGDDWPDLSAIRACTVGATVPNGHPLVQQHADWCSSRSGGTGAAREFCELILSAQGKLDALAEAYL
ncbi:HAD hydrolase family protein [Neptuniibacter sp. CAU 1671]|uniref:KdsC family phosphatase n=1 Tax=Neptuniibacter sp. CAU 1671 TaxID=3032593 RepID=UPI0023D97B5C|nr:HAD hydrolase family protein [Neptuniibacter sp. CAU 1671]MDF2182185.1 HAD hydrolase family protein [Neptuniibacter sp. CAU 1671]